jgi:hypothetical protein
MALYIEADVTSFLTVPPLAYTTCELYHSLAIDAQGHITSPFSCWVKLYWQQRGGAQKETQNGGQVSQGSPTGRRYHRRPSRH